ncbi:hypothetical protein [Alkalihalobacillus sp. TS-13]|nr:hypothetical protein [Alkalihalobacillus sp. TS-13]
MKNENNGNQRPNQPIEKGYKPKPITSQIKPPKGGTGTANNTRLGK